MTICLLLCKICKCCILSHLPIYFVFMPFQSIFSINTVIFWMGFVYSQNYNSQIINIRTISLIAICPVSIYIFSTFYSCPMIVHKYFFFITLNDNIVGCNSELNDLAPFCPDVCVNHSTQSCNSFLSLCYLSLENNIWKKL